MAFQKNSTIAIQAKKYKNRVVNADVVRELWIGAKSYDADKGVIITMNSFTKEAIDLSQRLKVRLINLSHEDLPSFEIINKWPYLEKNVDRDNVIAGHRKTDDPDFERFYRKIFAEIANLQGEEITWASGNTAVISSVTSKGITHVSRSQPLKMDIIRWSVKQLWDTGEVARSEINTQYPGRGSSFCFAILSSLSTFQHSKKPPILFYVS